MLFHNDVILSPENLRYLARQLRGLLALRKHLPLEIECEEPEDDFWELPITDMKEALLNSIKKRNQLHMERYGEPHTIDAQSIAEDPDAYRGAVIEPEIIHELTDLQDALLNQPKAREEGDGEEND